MDDTINELPIFCDNCATLALAELDDAPLCENCLMDAVNHSADQKIANKIARASLRLNIKDCSSGFRAYKASTMQNALGNMRTQYFSVQVEILDRIKEAGGKLMEMPCTYVARESGESKYNIKPAVKDGMTILKIARDHEVDSIRKKAGNIKDKFKDMKNGAGKIKSKGKDVFHNKFKNKFKNKFS